jgi:hypothetical protein
MDDVEFCQLTNKYEYKTTVSTSKSKVRHVYLHLPCLLTCIFCLLPRGLLFSFSFLFVSCLACCIYWCSLISFTPFLGLSCLLTFLLPFFQISVNLAKAIKSLTCFGV